LHLQISRAIDRRAASCGCGTDPTSLQHDGVQGCAERRRRQGGPEGERGEIWALNCKGDQAAVLEERDCWLQDVREAGRMLALQAHLHRIQPFLRRFAWARRPPRSNRTTQVQPENLVDVYCGCPRDNLCAARPCYANPATAAHPRPARRAARANPILVIVRTPMPRLQVQASRAVLHALPRAGREWRVAGAAGDVRPLLPGLPFPHLQRDWAHPCHICARSGLARDTSAPDGLTPPRSAPELCSWLATSAA
jgi:hypothetical protein